MNATDTTTFAACQRVYLSNSLLLLGRDCLRLGSIDKLGGVLGDRVDAHVALSGTAGKLANTSSEDHHLVGRDVLAPEEADSAAGDEDSEVRDEVIGIGCFEDLGELEIGGKLASNSWGDFKVLPRQLDSPVDLRDTNRDGHCTS